MRMPMLFFISDSLTSCEHSSAVGDTFTSFVMSQHVLLWRLMVLSLFTPFSYVDAFGTPVQHLASVFRHAFHGAVVVLVATDVAALYGKAPDVLRRNYAANTARTEYTREMAARILLAAAAQ